MNRSTEIELKYAQFECNFFASPSKEKKGKRKKNCNFPPPTFLSMFIFKVQTLKLKKRLDYWNLCSNRHQEKGNKKQDFLTDAGRIWVAERENHYRGYLNSKFQSIHYLLDAKLKTWTFTNSHQMKKDEAIKVDRTFLFLFWGSWP